MLGPVKHRSDQLFYVGFSLDERVPEDHPLRLILQHVDFSFVRREVASLYGDRGNESIDPIVVLKLIFLKFFTGTRSTRQVLRELPMRLDWMWFCQFDLTDEIPHHSVVSKARRRWGKAIFTRFFQRVLLQCVEAGLVDGEVVHVDASVIASDASKESLHVHLRVISEGVYDEEVAEDGDEAIAPPPSTEDGPPSRGDSNPPRAAGLGKKVSSTDPDARLIKKNDQHVLGYKDHRVVDDRSGIITATMTTPADVAEPHCLAELLAMHENNTGRTVKTPVADRQYGMAANYRMLHESGTKPCIPHKRVREDPTKFPRRLFVYDPKRDQYTCPAGQRLSRRARSDDNRFRYATERGVCPACPLKQRCTDATRGRTISRQMDQEMIDWADGCFSSAHRQRLMGRRKSKAEGSFADAANLHGHKRMHWRGLLNANVQNLIIATVQNIRKLICTARTRVAASHAAASEKLQTMVASVRLQHILAAVASRSLRHPVRRVRFS